MLERNENPHQVLDAAKLQQSFDMAKQFRGKLRKYVALGFAKKRPEPANMSKKCPKFAA